MKNVLYTLWLHSIPRIGPVLTRQLIQTLGSSFAVFNASPDELLSVDGIGPKLADLIFESKSLEHAKVLLDYCLKESIHLISFNDYSYPQRLQLYPHSPTLLYVKGDLLPLNKTSTAGIVGARRCSEYGKRATIDLATTLSTQQISIISGLAKGIDSYAHVATLKNNGYTLAIVGTGLDRCYPSEHLSLMQHIIEKGAVISQFPPFTPTHKQHFIRRNELVAMLSDSVYIMEASLKSGSLYTADCALTYKKRVFALPGSIYDHLSEGSNHLISKGANIYLPSQVNVVIPSSSNTTAPYSSKEAALCHLLKIQPLTLDALHLQLNLPTDILHELLFQLEISGHIYQSGGLIHLNN